MIFSIWSVWSYLTGLWMLFLSFRVLRFFDALPQLRQVVPAGHDFRWPRVSLIIPACNEVDTIRPAIESLRDLDYPELEIILIDDRSTDGTRAVVRELARQDNRIRVVEVDTLPPGWLGKTHALAKGEEQATGEWLLFTDADVHHRPESLKKAITECMTEEFDFLCVAPEMIAKSFALQACLAQFLQNASFTVNLARLNDSKAADAIGAGAYNLVKRVVFKRTAGFEWLKLEVIDDIGLAQMMKKAGARLGVLGGLGEISIEWYPSVPSFIRGVEKNSFAVFEYSMFAALAYFGLVLWSLLGFTLAPVMSGSWIAAFAAIVATATLCAITAVRVQRMMQIPAVIAVIFPLTSLLMPLLVLRSGILCLWRRGIFWRGTFYPLTELRQGQRLKSSEFIRRRFSKTKN